MEEEPLICSNCVFFNTFGCPFEDKVMELTYVETDTNFLTKEEKKEPWIKCNKYFD